MIEKFRLYRLNREHRNLCQQYKQAGREVLLHTALLDDTRVTEAASLLVLAQAHLEVTDDSYDAMIHRLADVSELLGASPEALQAALHTNEPSLAQSW